MYTITYGTDSVHGDPKLFKDVEISANNDLEALQFATIMVAFYAVPAPSLLSAMHLVSNLKTAEERIEWLANSDQITNEITILNIKNNGRTIYDSGFDLDYFE